MPWVPLDHPMPRRERGRRGMSARWAGHVPKHVTISSLSPETQRLVMALIAAAREQQPAATEQG